MIQGTSVIRLRPVLALAALLTSAPALAETIPKQQCLDAHVQAQEVRQAGKLRLAREYLKMCAHPSCPALVKDDCVPWLAEVSKQIPSVTVELQAEGLDPTGARVLLDGEAILPGNTVEVDPGEHTIQIEAEGHEAFRRTLRVEEGKQERVIGALRRKEEAPPPAEPRSRTVPLVLGGLGVVGLGAFAYLGITGKSQEEELKLCKPFCDPARVDAVSRRYLVANVALGVGVVALGTATYLWLRKPPKTTTTRVIPWVGPGLSGLGMERAF